MILVRHTQGALERLLAHYGLHLVIQSEGATIPGSYWGAPEAGLIGSSLLVLPDTPLHSALHEASHFVCMDAARRATLHTDAGGDHAEENAVCFLQILLAEHIPDFGRDRAFADMDAWGYSFRLGSARAWFEQDAEDARSWLLRARIIDAFNQPTWTLRQ